MQSKCILFVFRIAAPILAHGCNHSNCCVLSVVRTVNRPYIFHTSYFVKCGQQNTFLLLETKTSHPFLLHIPIRLFLFLKYQQDRYFFSCVPCQVEYHQQEQCHTIKAILCMSRCIFNKNIFQFFPPLVTFTTMFCLVFPQLTFTCHFFKSINCGTTCTINKSEKVTLFLYYMSVSTS